MPTIQWYPGHMAKAKRLLIDQLKRVDAVIELCDARLPLGSRNPDLSRLSEGKKQLLVLNKADLADPKETLAWVKRETGEARTVFAFNAMKDRATDAFKPLALLTQDLVDRQAARGIKKTVRAMVVGIPNVGKSTFINRLNGTPMLLASDRPGVTRANRWIRITPYLELLDTPGLLWPKLEDQRAAERLAWLGTIRNEIMDNEALALNLLKCLMEIKPKETRERFKLQQGDIENLLEAVAKGRGFLRTGGIPDVERAAAIVLDEFRAGKIARITLEQAQRVPR